MISCSWNCLSEQFELVILEESHKLCPILLILWWWFNHVHFFPFLLLQVLQHMKDLEIHQMQICDYEKEIQMQVIKLKQQQNLCETLRTERTVYSKNLIEAKVKGYIFFSCVYLSALVFFSWFHFNLSKGSSVDQWQKCFFHSCTFWGNECFRSLKFYLHHLYLDCK